MNKELYSRSGLCFTGDVTISTMDNCRFLLIGGKPINEPIVQHGPFVMNTKEEILKAMEDYQSGSFELEQCQRKKSNDKLKEEP